MQKPKMKKKESFKTAFYFIPALGLINRHTVASVVHGGWSLACSWFSVFKL